MFITTILFPCLLLFAPLQDGDDKRLTLQDLIKMFEKEATITLKRSGVTISSFNYTCEKYLVEALTFKPKGEGPFPGILLIPGYSRSARDYIPLGLNLAREGFTCFAVTQPGFGRSGGKPDWVGPRTMKAVQMGYEKFKREAYVHGDRMGVFGYSRGAVASALMAVRTKDLKGAVFAAGIYDLKKEYETNKNEGIRKNMEIETGLSEEAFVERSPLFMMDRLKCPVLILHGEKDVNASVEQAKRLRDRLAELEKDFEIKLYPDREHDIGRENLNRAIIDFFKRRLVEEKREKSKAEKLN